MFARFSTNKGLIVLISLLLVAINLRPALTSVAPILNTIGESLGLSHFLQGVLTTLPVLFLGIAAPLAPKLVRIYGAERSVLFALIVLAITLAVRPYTGASGMLFSTLLVGSSIGIINVLLPGIVKRDFPTQVGLMTGLYTVSLNVGAAAAAGVTEPLRVSLGNDWQLALAFWTLPAVIAAVVWFPQMGDKPIKQPGNLSRKLLRRDKLAWQVTTFMGFQSSLAYIVFGWLPTILQDRGLSAANAGYALSVCIMLAIVTALVVPWIGSRMSNQRFVIIASVLLVLLGYLGVFYAPISTLWLWIVLLGLGQGGSFALALTILALRAPNPKTASDLSAMAQGFGYIIAALGPLLVGIIHDAFESWDPVGFFIISIAIVTIIAAYGAGSNRLVVSTSRD